MSESLVKETSAQLMEKVVIGGDLSKLTTEERLSYYNHLCNSLGLNPLTRPFEYIYLSGKLTLYARKDCTEQLRRIYGVSITKLEREAIEGIYTVTAYATNSEGRQDSSLGAVSIENLKGEAKANAMMKAETKAKRRLTLSICGLGMLDETEVETIPDAVRPAVTERPAIDTTNTVPTNAFKVVPRNTSESHQDAQESDPFGPGVSQVVETPKTQMEAKKQELEDLMKLPCFNDDQRTVMKDNANKCKTLEGINKLLSRAMDHARKNIKAQQKADNQAKLQAQLEISPEDTNDLPS